MSFTCKCVIKQTLLTHDTSVKAFSVRVGMKSMLGKMRLAKRLTEITRWYPRVIQKLVSTYELPETVGRGGAKLG